MKTQNLHEIAANISDETPLFAFKAGMAKEVVEDFLLRLIVSGAQVLTWKTLDRRSGVARQAPPPSPPEDGRSGTKPSGRSLQCLNYQISAKKPFT